MSYGSHFSKVLVRPHLKKDPKDEFVGPDCGDGYKLDWNSDKDLLLQLSEKLSIYSEVTTWLPKAAIKERL